MSVCLSSLNSEWKFTMRLWTAYLEVYQESQGLCPKVNDANSYYGSAPKGGLHKRINLFVHC